MALANYLEILRFVVLLGLGFYLLERVAMAVRHPKAETLANYLYLPFSLAWICAMQTLTGPLLSRLINAAGGGVLARFIPPRRGIVAEVALSIAFAIAWDVWQYWVHRWQHASPLLWQIHRFHHSDPNVDASTQARNHPLNYLYLLACYTPVLLLFGSIAPHIITTILMFRVWGFVNHANLRISFGELTICVAGPQWHRIHHSREERHFDHNFAAFFPFIDRLFGTYYRPSKDEYPETGLSDREEGSFLREATISPFTAWYRAGRRAVIAAREKRTPELARESDSLGLGVDA